MRFLWIIQIAGAYRRSCYQQFADLSPGQIISVLIHDPNHQVVQRPADTSWFLLPVFRFEARYPSGRLGLSIHHVELGQWKRRAHFIDSLGSQASASLEKTP